MTQVSAVLFDMDGLIFDTETLAKECWHLALAEMGLRISDAELNGFIGLHQRASEQRCAAIFGTDFAFDSFLTLWRKHNQQLHHEQPIQIKPGYLALKQHLATRQIPAALVTSSRLATVERNFASLPEQFAQFKTLVTAESVTHGKPDPECYLLASKQLGVAAENCLVLEDSNNGMRAAISAGCQAVMVPDLLAPADDVQAGARAVLESLHQVIDLAVMA